MADNILSMSGIGDALRLHYLPGLRYQLNERVSALWAMLERDYESYDGQKLVMALRYGRNGGVGNRADDGSLPTPNARLTKQAQWDTRNVFARVQITDKTVRAARLPTGAFADELQQQLDDAMNDAKQSVSRQLQMDSVGYLAICSSGTDVATVTVDSTQYLAEGMRVDFYDTNTSAFITNGTDRDITAVDEENLTITVSGTANLSPTATTRVVAAGNRAIELTGLAAVLSSTTNTVYGINRTTTANSFFRPTRVNVNGSIDDIQLQTGVDEADRKGGSVVKWIETTFGVRRGYQLYLTAQRRNADVLDLKGGYKAISFNGIPLNAEKYAVAQHCYFLDLDDWKLYALDDWDWLDRDGAVLSRISGKPAWEATLALYCDTGCAKPRGQVDLYGITEA